MAHGVRIFRWRWAFQGNAFGELAAESDPLSTGDPVEYNLRFPGQYFDAESGLHYNYFRDYELGTGRYIESDPIGLWGGVETYPYANGDPLIRVDSYGLSYFDYVQCMLEERVSGMGYGARDCRNTNPPIPVPKPSGGGWSPGCKTVCNVLGAPICTVSSCCRILGAKQHWVDLRIFATGEPSVDG